MDSIKVKAIKSKFLAGWLMYSKGFDLVNKEKDRKNPKYDVYLFYYNKQLDQAIEEYNNIHGVRNK